ncbi:DUF1028 domain-containing protein [Acetobacter orientalis]|uniref:Major pilin protein fimA n=1 Tax=Acetobacter orientalis TaxID=146474 RepID=A0A2Z5ZHX5_9PROT|nr:DUF1028 domain-containing protein [Acetobacter orientalis]BBC79995.1 major pilin protein fimA [Acetobacter orientalis]GAN66824.1 hypothetical protein Abor_029_007 [Acetobacter orientalis]GEL62694.1 hypothetical protein AOR02nite_25360 [Acetobacter orientalis]
MTFSIIARCTRTGQFGMAVSSSSPAVASRCAFARAGVGVVATQNITDPSLGPKGLELMAHGASAELCLQTLVEQTPYAAYRQLSVIDCQGQTAQWSGTATLGLHAMAKHINIACAGNMLANVSVPQIMLDAFLQSDETQELGQRLLIALKAGLAGGGEAGPVYSAGLVVVADQSWPLTDLRVDWDDAPIEKLQQIWDVWSCQMHDYTQRALAPAYSPSYGVPGDNG